MLSTAWGAEIPSRGRAAARERCPDRERVRVAIAEQIADAWNAAGVPYAVVHGLEPYPDAIGRDLDVLVEPAALPAALDLAASVLRDGAWSPVSMDRPWATWLFGLRRGEDGIIGVEIDLIRRLQWGPTVLALGAEPDLRIGPFHCSRWGAFAKNVLMKVLGGGAVSTSFSGLTSAGLWMLRERLDRLVGPRLRDDVLGLVRRNDLIGLQRLAPSLRRALLVRSFRRPVPALQASATWLHDSWRSLADQGGAPVLALVGPDGAGKSSRVSDLRTLSSLPFTGFEVRHWRPGLLPALARLLGRRIEAESAVPPRRAPGRFQWLRLGYYALDFLMGSRTLDRYASLRLRPVVYDRCGLDMGVDPARYGLRSGRGVRSVWRLTRRPDAVVLLYDEPEVLSRRKSELSGAEIDAQLQAWLSLAEEGQVDLMLPAGASPGVLQAALEEILWDCFRRKNRLLANQATERDAALHWIGSQIAVPPARVRVKSFANDSGSGASLVRPAVRFATLPGDRRPRALMQVGTPSPDLRALLNPQRWLARSAVSVAGRLLRSEWVRRRFPLALKVDLPERASSAGGAPPFLGQWIADRLNVPEVGLHIATGTPGGHRKLVVQVVGSDGGVLAYAKVGWNPTTVRLVRHEEQVLRAFRSRPLASASVPVVIGSGSWLGRYVLLLEPFPRASIAGANSAMGAAHIDFLEELSSRGGTRGVTHPSEARARLGVAVRDLRAMGFHLEALLVEEASGRLLASESAIPLAPCHGDFAPWNVRWVGSRLFVSDWEDARDSAPFGFDLFHWVMQTSGLLRREGAHRVLARLGFRGRPDASVRLFRERAALGSGEFVTLFALYLVDRLCHSLRLDGDGANPSDRRQRRLWMQLLGVLCLRRTLKTDRTD